TVRSGEHPDVHRKEGCAGSPPTRGPFRAARPGGAGSGSATAAPRRGGTDMAIVVIGLNHRTAPLDVLERVTLNGDARAKALVDLRLRPNLSEVVLLSTCNRTEVYAATERFHGAYADIRDFFCGLAGLAPDELALHLVSQYDEEAATHLFEVAAGLRSAVLGESEILGQVRDAWLL